MLIRFRAGNFRSLKGEQELSMVAASSLKGDDDKAVHVDSIRKDVLRAAAIYGGNASGKTNVVNALEFMHRAVLFSHQRWKPESGIPVVPFAFSGDDRDEGSLFEADVLIEGIRYRYGFVVTRERVIEEWLSAYPYGKEQRWFARTPDRKTEYEFGRNLTGRNRTIAELTKRNSLFLSAAAQNNHPKLTPLYRWFSSHLSCILNTDRRFFQLLTNILVKGPETKRDVVQLLVSSDVGIDDIRVEGLDTEEYIETLKGAVPPVDLEARKPGAVSRQWKGIYIPELPKIHFTHKLEQSSGHELELEDESDGTQALYGLAGPIFMTLLVGGTMVVDELESSLHPMIARQLVTLFNSSEHNPNGAQLIFTTQSTNLLRDDLLRRDQIWFTEKDGEGATHLYPLTDFNPRRSENIERGYLQGRYGAIPFLGSFDFMTRADDKDGKKAASKKR